VKLLPDSRLGPYEVLAAIGAGGMGEVYRARDMRLGLILLWYAVRPAPPRLDEFLETRF